jgi:hypothetical protein
LEEFVGGVARASLDHPVQRENAERYYSGPVNVRRGW